MHTYNIANRALTFAWPVPWSLGPSPGLLDPAWVRPQAPVAGRGPCERPVSYNIMSTYSMLIYVNLC